MEDESALGPTRPGHGRAASAPLDADPKTTGTMSTARDDLPAAPGAFVEAWPENDRYALMREIARGGGGRIAIAMDRKLGRRIALKQPLDRGGGQRLEREAMVMARLEHPSIVPIHDAGRGADGTPFYAMKLLGGPNLSERIREATTFEQRLGLLRVVDAVADAMAYAHAQGVIHRDLKPANVVVGEFGEVAVIDWGLAKAIAEIEETPGASTISAELTVDGAVMGTPAYMAPEQAVGGAVDARADVYALGAMLYQVLTGETPYGKLAGREQLVRLASGPPRPVDEREPRVPADLAAIVGKAMARAPDDRYPTARELADDLHRYETGKLVAAHRYSPITRARRWVRRHRFALASAIAAIAAGGAAAVLLLGRGHAIETCSGLDAPARAAWGASERAAVEAAFRGRGADALRGVLGTLDERASALTAMRVDACRAREVAAQSSEVVDQRMACLDERTGELRAVAGAIAGLQPDELDHAGVALGAMGSIGDCADLAHLREAPRPSSPSVRAEIQAADEQLAAVDADDLVGRVRPALAAAAPLVGRALATGYAPLVAHALERLGTNLAGAGDKAGGERLLREAIIESERARDDRRRGQAMIELARNLSAEHDQQQAALDLATQAAAIAERLGDRELQAASLSLQAGIAYQREDPTSALALARRVVALRSGPAIPPILRAQALALLGKQLAAAQQYDEANATMTQALRELRAASAVDDTHDIAIALSTLGTMALYQSHFAVAEDYLRQAVAMLDRVEGPDAQSSLNARTTLADVYKMEDRYPDAERVLDEVRDRLERQPDPNEETLGTTLDQLGDVLADEDKYQEAHDAYARAAELFRARGPIGDEYGVDLAEAAGMLVELERNREAIPSLVEALGVLEQHPPAPTADDVVPVARAALGHAYLATGDAARARPLLAASLPEVSKGEDAVPIARVERDLAVAEWETGDRAAAATHARAARAHLVAAGKDAAPKLADLDAWMSARGLGR